LIKPSFLELLRTLAGNGVEHVVVGGVAAILEGAPITTFDLDVVYRTDDENVRRLAAALAGIDAVYRDPADRRIEPTPERLRDNRVNLLETRIGQLDAMQCIGAGWTHSDVRARAHPLRIGDLEVWILDLAAIIESKQAADRDKDRAMLPILRRTLEQRSESEP
jgi:hypothetical protein